MFIIHYARLLGNILRTARWRPMAKLPLCTFNMDCTINLKTRLPDPNPVEKVKVIIENQAPEKFRKPAYKKCLWRFWHICGQDRTDPLGGRFSQIRVR